MYHSQDYTLQVRGGYGAVYWPFVVLRDIGLFTRFGKLRVLFRRE
jgi:hypothetical protein